MKVSKTLLNAATTLIAAQAAGAEGWLEEWAGANMPLIDFYNANVERFLEGGKPVKRFPKKEVAIERCVALAQKIVDAPNAPAKTREPGQTSAAIAQTWDDPAVRAARTARHHVKVGDVVYRSVAAAFKALNLDFKHHAKFRAQLVNGEANEFDGHKFRIVDAAPTPVAA